MRPHASRPARFALAFRLIAAATLPLQPCAVGAQDDADSTGFVLRPTFGLGAGMLAFKGDIGDQHDGYSPLLARVGYELRAGTPLTPWLHASLFAIHGRVGANERSLERNLNFESRITMGGLQLTYDFDHLLGPRYIVGPYISLGFESVEFLSKTDLYDREGRLYNYWSDGTIRDIAEDAPNAGDAVMLQRDHIFESDIRELDLDGFGKYPERTWAIPVGVGANMRMGGGWNLRLGATMHFTRTDLIDGVTDESIGERAGDAKLDRLLFSSFSLSWMIDLDKKKKTKGARPTISSEEMDMLVLNDDEDGDGISDFKDLCPNTPAGVIVSERGCPMDSDGDGVPDHLDDEAGTPFGSPVNERGVAIAEGAFLKDYLNFKDSGNVNIVTSRVESLDSSPRTRPISRKRFYTVQVGSEVQGITEALMQKLLSIPDIRTVEHGDTISFVVGGYNDLPEAIRRQLALKGEGVDGMVVAEEDGALIDVAAEVAAAQAKMGGEAAPLAEAKTAVVRVQLGAFKEKLSRNIFEGIKDLVVLKGDDGLTRYYTGSFTDVNAAAKHKVDMLLKGFTGAFLTAFRDGKRITLKAAGAKLTGPENLKAVPLGSINKSLIKFRVQVGTFAGNVPMDVMGKYIEVGNVQPVTSADAVRYYYGTFGTRAEADAARTMLQEKGLSDAFVVGALGDRIIPADEADRLMAQP